MAFDGLARASYESLVLQQPHVHFAGLWQREWQFFAVCPELMPETKARDGQSLVAWFGSHRAMTAPVVIVKEPPAGAVQVPMRSLDDVIEQRGAFRTNRDVFVDLHLALPPDFPNFIFRSNAGAGTAVVEVARPLSPEEEQCLKGAYESVEMPFALQVTVKAGLEAAREEFRFPGAQGDMNLLPSRRIRQDVARELRSLVEDDDEFWANERRRVLGTTTMQGGSDVLRGPFRERRASCIVNAAVFPPRNLRSYLTVYEVVNLVAPLAETLRPAERTRRVAQRDCRTSANRPATPYPTSRR